MNKNNLKKKKDSEILKLIKHYSKTWTALYKYDQKEKCSVCNGAGFKKK